MFTLHQFMEQCRFTIGISIYNITFTMFFYSSSTNIYIFIYTKLFTRLIKIISTIGLSRCRAISWIALTISFACGCAKITWTIAISRCNAIIWIALTISCTCRCGKITCTIYISRCIAIIWIVLTISLACRCPK